MILLNYIIKEIGEMCSKLPPRVYHSRGIVKLEWILNEESRVIFSFNLVYKNYFTLKINRLSGEDSFFDYANVNQRGVINKFLDGLGIDILLCFHQDFEETETEFVLKPSFYKSKREFVEKFIPFFEIANKVNKQGDLIK